LESNHVEYGAYASKELIDKNEKWIYINNKFFKIQIIFSQVCKYTLGIDGYSVS
jgi:hypothetical protein